MTTQIEHFMSGLCNIAKHEWGRVFAAWTLKLLAQIATVLGATLLIVFCVEEYGIENLPVLFIVQALFIMGGTFLFADILKNHSHKTLFTLGGLTGGIFVLIAFFSHPTSLIGWVLLLFAFSVVIAQMNILLALFIEELFTPLESERTFPVVESAEPIGTLIAGIITAGGVIVFHAHVEDFLWIWAGVFFAFLPVFFFFEKKLKPVPIPRSREEKREKISKIAEFREMFAHIKTIPFLRSLLLIVFLHWMAFHLVEFQFTKAVDMGIEHGHAAEHGTDHDAAAQLTHGLGRLHILISVIFLISQLIFASRIMKRFGLMRSILIHPITSFLSSLIMLLKFSFFSAVGTKTVYEVVGGLKRNAYHASFYALRPRVRERAKEFLEGIARPFGMILGTSVLLLIQYLAPEDYHDTFISGGLMVIFGVMCYQALRLSQKYTFLAKKNLETHGHAPEKLDAIEILAQKGHENPGEHLIKSLVFRKEKPEVQIKVLKTLGMLQDPMAIPEIIKFLHHSQQEVQLAAIGALSKYQDLETSPYTKTFSRHRVVEVLQNLFAKTRSKKIKSAIIEVLKNIRHKDIVPFLLKILESSDPKIRADAIYICGLFHDVSTAYYLEKFLDDPDPRIKSNAIIALWKFIPYRLKLLMRLNVMLESTDTDELLSGIYAVGEAKLIQEVPRLKKLLEHKNEDVHRHASVALFKIGESLAIDHVVTFIIHPKKRISERTRMLIAHVDEDLKKGVKRRLTQRMSQEIFRILEQAKTEILEEMSNETLEQLLWAYEILEEEREMLEVKEILEQRKNKVDEANIPKKENIQKSGSGISLEDLLG